jgi:hypothetical protein
MKKVSAGECSSSATFQHLETGLISRGRIHVQTGDIVRNRYTRQHHDTPFNNNRPFLLLPLLR